MGNCASADSNTRETKAKAAARKFEAFRDRFETIEEVQKGLRDSGLESSDVILAIDLTKSNEWSGTESFGGQLLQNKTFAMNVRELFHSHRRRLSCRHAFYSFSQTISCGSAGLSLHSTSQTTNPYKSVVTIVCKTLSGALLTIHACMQHVPMCLPGAALTDAAVLGMKLLMMIGSFQPMDSETTSQETILC